MTDATSTDLRFEPPGPGTWELDPVHFPRPVTQYWVEIHPPAYTRGVQEFMAYYGTLLDGIAMQLHQRLCVPHVGSRRRRSRSRNGSRAPKRCGPRSSGAISSASGTTWPSPPRSPPHRELQAVEPDALTDAELIAYLTRCRDHHSLMISQHMRYTGAAMISVGDLLAHVGDWTGVPPSQVLGMMRGTAPVSAGASDELERFIAAINAGRVGAPTPRVRR